MDTYTLHKLELFEDCAGQIYVAGPNDDEAYPLQAYDEKTDSYYDVYVYEDSDA